MTENVWFSDWDEDEGSEKFPWQPRLMGPDNYILSSLSIWFQTEAECDGWIGENLLNVRQERDTHGS